MFGFEKTLDLKKVDFKAFDLNVSMTTDNQLVSKQYS